MVPRSAAACILLISLLQPLAWALDCGKGVGPCQYAEWSCCSEYGFCGSTPDHCNAKCQPEYSFNGKCEPFSSPTSNSSSSSTSVPSSTPVAMPVPHPAPTPSQPSNSNCDLFYKFDTLSPDFVIDNGDASIVDGALRLTMRQGSSVKLSHRGTFHYGKYTFKARASTVPGAVSAVVLLSPSGDEIDVEWVGKNTHQFESNFFVQGILEYSIYGGRHMVSSGIGQWNTYTVEWTSQFIRWSLNGVVVRTWTRAKSWSMKHGRYMFPDTISQFQIGLWDGSQVSSWAGGPIQWANHPNGVTMDISDVCIKRY